MNYTHRAEIENSTYQQQGTLQMSLPSLPLIEVEDRCGKKLHIYKYVCVYIEFS